LIASEYAQIFRSSHFAQISSHKSLLTQVFSHNFLYRRPFLKCRMIRMKTSLAGLAVAALLVVGSTLSLTSPGFAEDAPTPQTPAAQAPAMAPAAQTDAPSGTVPRPSIAPKTAEPAPPVADAEPAAPRHRRYAHYRHRRYGYYRTAYWEPFPIYWPHVYHNRLHWNRIPWLFRF
jgi:hypothetical protein